MPKWLVGVTVLDATAEIHPHLEGWQLLMSSPEQKYVILPKVLRHPLLMNRLDCNLQIFFYKSGAGPHNSPQFWDAAKTLLHGC